MNQHNILFASYFSLIIAGTTLALGVNGSVENQAMSGMRDSPKNNEAQYLVAQWDYSGG